MSAMPGEGQQPESIQVTMGELFQKVGILTFENDKLREAVAARDQLIAALKAQIDGQPEPVPMNRAARRSRSRKPAAS